MNINIENINKIGNNHKRNKTPWRKIYEVIQQEFFEETQNLPEELFKKCKNNTNEPHNIPTGAKNNLKRMDTKQGLYAQMIMIRIKDLKITEENKNKNDDKFKLQGQPERSQSWFDLDFDWIEEKISTHEPDLYRKIYQNNYETQDINTFKTFVVPIDSSKNMEEIKFNTDTPMLKYRQNTSNSCCFSSLASYF